MKRRTFLLTTMGIPLATNFGGITWAAPVPGNKLQYTSIEVPDDATDVFLSGEIRGEEGMILIYAGLDDYHMVNNTLLNVVEIERGHTAYWMNSLVRCMTYLPTQFKIYYSREDQQVPGKLMDADLTARAVEYVEIPSSNEDGPHEIVLRYKPIKESSE